MRCAFFCCVFCFILTKRPTEPLQESAVATATAAAPPHCHPLVFKKLLEYKKKKKQQNDFEIKEIMI